MSEIPAPRAMSSRAAGVRRIATGAPHEPADRHVLPGLSLEDIRALLTADLRAQRLRTSRITALHLLAAAGGLCWVMMNWPKVLPIAWHMVALVGWPAGLALLLLFGILEWRWSDRLVRLTRR